MKRIGFNVSGLAFLHMEGAVVYSYVNIALESHQKLGFFMPMEIKHQQSFRHCHGLVDGERVAAVSVRNGIF